MKITKNTLKQLIREEIQRGEAASSVKPIGERMYTFTDTDGNTYYSDAAPATTAPVPRQLMAIDTVGKHMIPFLSTLLQLHHDQQHLEPEVEPEAEPEVEPEI